MRWQHLHGTISNFRVGQLVRSELLKAQKDPMKKIIFDYLDCSLHDFTSKSRRHHLIDQTSWVRMVSKLKPYLGGLPVLGRVGCPHKSPLMTIMGPGMADLLGERSLPTIHFHTTCIFKILSYITLLQWLPSLDRFKILQIVVMSLSKVHCQLAVSRTTVQ